MDRLLFQNAPLQGNNIDSEFRIDLFGIQSRLKECLIEKWLENGPCLHGIAATIRRLGEFVEQLGATPECAACLACQIERPTRVALGESWKKKRKMFWITSGVDIS